MNRGTLVRALIASSVAFSFFQTRVVADTISKLPGHVPAAQIKRSIDLGRTSSSLNLQLAVTLKPKDPTGLTDLITRLYAAGDPIYHQFLTPGQFTDQFAPSQDDVTQITQYLTSQGFSVVKTHSNRMVIDVVAPVSTVESAFQLELHDYIAPDGRLVHAPTSDPDIPDAIASKLSAIVGMNAFARPKPHRKRGPKLQSLNINPHTGSVSDYMTPANIKSAYSLGSVTATGSGEKLALYELDGYKASDIATYASQFSFTAPTLKNVLINGATGSAGSGADEVTLDIELAMAMAPGLSEILVYEGPQQTDSMTQTQIDTETVDVYNQIASDDLANEVSTSWGLSENEMDQATMNAENNIFAQMAAQGQSFFAAAGDSGAYDDSANFCNGDPNANTTLEVDDPGSQPYATSVGGTTLNPASIVSGSWSYSGSYVAETSWETTTHSGTCGSSYSGDQGGGGGISTIWSVPSWQSGLNTGTGSGGNLGSSTMRMVPDISFDADPNTGYPIYFTDPTQGAGFYLFGGTSCAAPLWAAFSALVNQKRVANGLSRIGLFNATLYPIAQSGSYSSAFNDIADGSTNLHFPAETGYDLTTGWGSLIGSGLFNAMVAATPPSAPSTLTVTALTNLTISTSWTAVSGSTLSTLMRSTSKTGPFTAIQSSITGTSYTDSAVSYGTTYYYYVTTANSSSVDNGYSAVQSATATVNPPGSPSNLKITVSQ